MTILWWFLPYIDMNQPWVYICPSITNPTSYLRPHPIHLYHPSAPALSALFHASNLDWSSISHMVNICFNAILSNHPTLTFLNWGIANLHCCVSFKCPASDSVIHIQVCTLSQILFHYMLLSNSEYACLCYTSINFLPPASLCSPVRRDALFHLKIPFPFITREHAPTVWGATKWRVWDQGSDAHISNPSSASNSTHACGIMQVSF